MKVKVGATLLLLVILHAAAGAGTYVRNDNNTESFAQLPAIDKPLARRLYNTCVANGNASVAARCCELFEIADHMLGQSFGARCSQVRAIKKQEN